MDALGVLNEKLDLIGSAIDNLAHQVAGLAQQLDQHANQPPVVIVQPPPQQPYPVPYPYPYPAPAPYPYPVPAPYPYPVPAPYPYPVAQPLPPAPPMPQPLPAPIPAPYPVPVGTPLPHPPLVAAPVPVPSGVPSGGYVGAPYTPVPYPIPPYPPGGGPLQHGGTFFSTTVQESPHYPVELQPGNFRPGMPPVPSPRMPDPPLGLYGPDARAPFWWTIGTAPPLGTLPPFPPGGSP